MKTGLLTFAILAITNLSFAQKAELSYWKSTVKKSKSITITNKTELTNSKLFSLDINSLKSTLDGTPKKGAVLNSTKIASFPDVDGNIERFSIMENSNMDPELAARYPEIKSYVGQGIDEPSAIIYFSISPLGLQTMLIHADKSAEFIEPFTTDLSSYIVYRKSDKSNSLDKFECSVVSAVNRGTNLTARPNADDGFLRTYRLALSVTGEYTVFFGGTKALALAAMNASMTRVNGVFEIDFGVHMNMIANEDAIIYLTAGSDPYSPAATGANGAWNQELQTNLTNVIGNTNYDIGHLFGASGGGGNAGCIGCVCVNPTGLEPLGKGSGFTSPADDIPQGDNFDIDYVAHEMGHQFGGNHTFTFSNEGTIAQVEPGSGNTIMGYAGITGATDVQPHSDAFFHAISIQQITNYIKTTSCQTNTTTNNSIPTANAGLDYTVPKGTPFMLTGAGTDANGGDVLTYCWEQMNTGTSTTTFPSTTATSGPAFKSFLPSINPIRYFPQLSTIKTGATSWTWEAVPNIARTLSFRLTVRDNHAGGPANNSDDMVVTVNGTAGPFAVTAPNTAVSWAGGSTQTVTWNVAGTTANSVNTANVDILLSTDGGDTYPTTILAATPNDGTQTITVPSLPGAQNRIMVKGTNHIFFDISNTNFTITGPAETEPPTAPTNLAANGTTTTTTNLTWNASTDNVGVTGYDVYKNSIFLITVASTSYTVPGLSPSTTYSFFVKARDAAGNISDPSNTVNVTTLDPCLPENPVSVTIAASPSSNVCMGTTVTFTATPTNPGSTPIYQWKKNGTNVGSNTTTYSDDALITGDLITCVLTSDVSCATGNPATSNTITMTVNTNINDNNACTIDACNTTTGVITHTTINIDDGDPCTTDACTTTATTTTLTFNGASGLPLTWTSTTPSLPDFDIATLNVTGFPLGAVITNVSASVNLNHTWGGDMQLYLEHPDGIEFVGFVNDPTDSHLQFGSNAGAGPSLPYSFTSTGATMTILANTGTANPIASPGPYKPVDGSGVVTTFATFNGLDPNGTWTLYIGDDIDLDGGKVELLSVTITAGVVNTVITHTPIVTDDGNVCTTDACDSQSGAITHSPVNADDGNACTTDGCNSVSGTPANLLLSNDFNFSGLLTANGWTAHNSGGTNPISTTTGLTYTGYPGSGIGNAALLGNTGGEDDNIAITTQNTNGQDVYFSCMVNVTDPSASKTGDYFIHFNQNATTFAARVFVKYSVAGVVNFGLSNNTTATYGTTAFAKNTTYLLVVKYTITTGGTDPVSLWVIPSGIPASEVAAGTAEAINTTTTGIDIINAIALRQGNNGSSVQTIVDGIRVGKTWSSVTTVPAAAGIFHTPVNTDDGNVCTVDGCDSSTGVYHNAANNDDGNACTNDGCNSTTGQVFHDPLNTDDGNACTTDGCDSSSGIFHNEANTDDNNPCTIDACNIQSGAITHTQISADDSNPCTTDGCDSNTGIFHNDINTNDGNPCTTDGCNSVSGEFHNAVNTDDGNACTTDGCDSNTGVFHTDVNTDDGNVCTTDGCNSNSGVFHNQVNTDDGNPCTTDGCNSSTGIFHTNVNTDDGNACTVDECNSSNGTITHTQVPTSDGDVCTSDACNTSTGNISHTPVPVDDGIPCTVDGCNSITGVFHTQVNCSGATLYSNIFLEGYYIGGGLMNNCLFATGVSSDPTDADFITISAMNPVAPYGLVDSKTATLKTNGNVSVTFGPAVIAGNSYYLKVTHRNAVTTWSSSAVVLSSLTTYIFSDAANKALGDNQVATHMVGSTTDGFGFSFYSGDIADGNPPGSGVQDGSIDATDYLDLDPHIQNGDGGYLISDLNGDGSVDATDFLIMDPNIQQGVGGVNP